MASKKEKKADLSGFQAVADAEPMYERFQTVHGHTIEVFDSSPGQTEEDGVYIRLTRALPGAYKSTEVYLDPKAQQDLALALIANLKE